MRYGICFMKIPFSVLYFSSNDTFFFYWRTGFGMDDTIAEDKSSISVYHHQHVCMYQRVCFVVGLFSAMGLYLSMPFSSSRQYSAGPYHVLFAIASC